MKEALVDTDILSFFFKGDENVIRRAHEYLNQYDQLNLSIITYYEITAGLKFKKAKRQLEDFEIFVRNNNTIYITEESAKISADIYADLRTKGTTIGTADILIAGIALTNELTLITNNEKHYLSINNLSIENWKK